MIFLTVEQVIDFHTEIINELEDLVLKVATGKANKVLIADFFQKNHLQ